jgi:hypothetical protein
MVGRVQLIVGKLVRLIAVMCVLMICSAGPASAHSAAGSPSSNYVTTLDGVRPATNAFKVAVIESGSRLEVTWLSGPPLIVEGYENDPYLRIGPAGVEQNSQSPAVYINRTRQGTDSPPESINPDGPAVWVKVSSTPIARFHDHRIHYMGSVPPPKVSDDPSTRQLVQPFEIKVHPGTLDAVPVLITGRVEWVPGPSAGRYFAIAAVLALVLAGVALWAGIRLDRRPIARTLTMVAAFALMTVDIVHLVGIAGGVQGGSLFARLVSIGYASIAAWLMTMIALVLLVRKREDALYLITFAAGLITLVGGVADIGILSKSSVVFLWAAPIARAVVASTLGLGIGVVAAGVLLTRPVKTSPMASVEVSPVGALHTVSSTES